ncbi:hypothetical protein T492DRAFT_932811 [Pavlovales sp. CCMP2436]|nr:hypothetical protein T492DRAFT_932811 [Pavlovales sp. CCMP2436]
MVALITRESSPVGIGRPSAGGAARRLWRPPGPARADKCRASNAPQSAPPSHAPGEAPLGLARARVRVFVAREPAKACCCEAGSSAAQLTHASRAR